MASPLFSKGFLQQIFLHAHLSIYLPQTTVLSLHRLHLRHHRRTHAAILRTPLVKAGAAHAILSAKIGNRYTACLKIPMICATLNRGVFIRNLLRYTAEKVLFLNTTNLRGGHQIVLTNTISLIRNARVGHHNRCLKIVQFTDLKILFLPDYPIDIGDVAQNYSGNFFADIRYNVI